MSAGSWPSASSTSKPIPIPRRRWWTSSRRAPGLSAEEIERYITIPIETQTSALRNLNTVRTISLYGLSDVKLQFTFDYTYEEALQQVLNRLSQLPPLLNNAQPQISPVSPIGEIYRYKLVGPPGLSTCSS